MFSPCHNSYSLTDSLRNLYQKFVSENSDIKMSFVTFTRCRPKYIKLVRYTTRRQCLCQKCANFCLLLKPIANLPRSPPGILKLSDDDILNCIDNLDSEKDVSYRQWMRVEVDFKGKTIKKVKLTDIVKNKVEYREAVKSVLGSQREHDYRIGTQYKQVKQMRESLRPNLDVSVQMDYSENWAAKFPDEIVAAYYDKSQISIHPMVVHFQDDDGVMKHSSFVGVTKEGSHTVPTTYAFLRKLIDELKQLFPNLKSIHFVSDSPSSQYRNKNIVEMLSRSYQLWGVNTSWTWLETGHGKGPCDGVGGSIKRKMDDLVKRGEVVRSSDEFCAVVIKEKTEMNVIHVTTSEIQDSQKEVSRWDPVPVKGLIRMHALAAKDGFFYIRETSCFKSCCFIQGRFIMKCPNWLPTNVELRNTTDTDSDDDVPLNEIAKRVRASTSRGLLG